MKIVQIEESDVIKNICNDVPVFRLKVDDCHICNLQDKSIKTIKRDMQNDVQYLYFILVKGEYHERNHKNYNSTDNHY